MKSYNKKIISFSLLVILLLFFVFLLFFIDPQELVETIGIQNGYLIAFSVSLFGGLSAGGSVTYIGMLITLVVAGLNPITLGVLSGIALAIGDSIMFYTGSKGRELMYGKWKKKIDYFSNLVENNKLFSKSVPILAYLYMSFAPLPNDILLLFLAAVEFPPKKMGVIIILGDLTFALMITLVTAKGIVLFG